MNKESSECVRNASNSQPTVVCFAATTTAGFGFFYPCLFVGGLGLLGLFAVLLGASDANTPGPNGMVYAYVITPEHCVVATGEQHRRTSCLATN